MSIISTMKITEEKVVAHKNATHLYREGMITHRDRIKAIKAAGITGVENIELDNAYAEREEAEQQLNQLSDKTFQDGDEFDFHKLFDRGE